MARNLRNSQETFDLDSQPGYKAVVAADRTDQDDTPDQPAWLEPLDHTADTGIIVRAGDLKQLFARAAWGMFSVITDLSAVRTVATHRVSVEANDTEALLVRWLSDLNFRHVTQHELFCQFDVLDLSENKLTAEVRGEKIDPGRHTIFTEIKAVTFHGLQVKRVNSGWRAQIIFDL